jgi:hypothetical protein
MEDDNFWHLGSVTKWNSQFLIHTWTFLTIVSVASQLFLCFFWISLWLTNRCLQHSCFKNLCKIAQASKTSDSNAQHFLSDLRTHSWFHSMLFALSGYRFPYIVMNRCLYLSPSYCSPHRQPVGSHDKWGVHTETERIYLAFGPRLTFLGRQAGVCCPSTWVLTTLAPAHHKLGLVIYVSCSQIRIVSRQVWPYLPYRFTHAVSEKLDLVRSVTWMPVSSRDDVLLHTSQPKGWCKSIEMLCTERRGEETHHLRGGLHYGPWSRPT